MARTTLTFSTVLLLLAAVTTTAAQNATASAANDTATTASTVYATATTNSGSAATTQATAASGASSTSAGNAAATQTTAASGANSTSAANAAANQTAAASGANSTFAANAAANQTTAASGANSTSAANATSASGSNSTTIQASNSTSTNTSASTTAAPLSPSCGIVNNGTAPGNFQLAVSPQVLSSNTVYNVTVGGTGNATVVLQAMASTSFVGSWSKKDSTCTGGSPLYTVLLDANTPLVAQWTSGSNLNAVVISAYIQVNNTYKHTVTLNPAPTTASPTTIKNAGTTNKWSFDLAASLIVLMISTKLLL